MKARDLTYTRRSLLSDYTSAGWSREYFLTTLVTFIICTILAVLRIYVKARLIKQWKWADVTFVLAWASFAAFSAMLWILFRLSSIEQSFLEQGISFQQAGIISQRIYFAVLSNYSVAMCLSRISILLQFIDIFAPTKRTGRWWILIILVLFDLVSYITFLIIVMRLCSHNAKLDPNVATEDQLLTCDSSQNAFFLATGVLNIFDDSVMVALPMFWLARLRIASVKRLGVWFVFTLGGFVCICSTMRLFETSKFDRETGGESYLIWMSLEISSALMAACLPYMPRLFRRRDPRQPSRSWFEERFEHVTPGQRRYQSDRTLIGHIPANDARTSADEEWQSEAFADFSTNSTQSVPAVPAVPQMAILKTVHIEQKPVKLEDMGSQDKS